DRRRDVLDVRGDRVAEQHQHDDRQHEREAEAPRVTPELNGFLASDRPQASDAKNLWNRVGPFRYLASAPCCWHRKVLGDGDAGHEIIAPPACLTRDTNTSSSEAGTISMDRHRRPAASMRSRMTVVAC